MNAFIWLSAETQESEARLSFPRKSLPTSVICYLALLVFILVGTSYGRSSDERELCGFALCIRVFVRVHVEGTGLPRLSFFR